MCNLSGYIGKNPSSDKLKLLLVLGRERGTDSVGVNINNKITKEVSSYTSKKGDSLNFVPDNYSLYSALKKDEYNVVMQHNRKKSSGTVNIKAAHPYAIEYTDDKDDNKTHTMYFMHNGTITNIVQLCQKYGHTYTEYETDSEALGNLILEHGAEEVLQWYEGGAALVWYYSEDPTTVYMWKGASAKWVSQYATYQNKKVETERPLHFLETEGGIYFASLQAHLEAISTEKLDYDTNPVYTIGDNTLSTFKGGELVNNLEIKRKSIPAPKVEKKTVVKGFNNNYGKKTRISFNGYSYQEITKSNNFETRKKASGCFLLNSEGEVVPYEYSGYAEFFYFINGYLMRDSAYFHMNKNIVNYSPTTYSAHPFSLVADAFGKRFYDGKLVTNGFIKPIFSEVYVETNHNGYFAGCYTATKAIQKGKLSFEQLARVYYTHSFALNIEAAHPYTINKYNSINMQSGRMVIEDWMYFYPENIKNVHPKYIKAFEEYIEGSNVDTAESLKRKKQAFYNDLFTNLDSEEDDKSEEAEKAEKKALAAFNENYDTNFVNVIQANTWFFIYKGNQKYEYRPSWGLDQFWITSYNDRKSNEIEKGNPNPNPNKDKGTEERVLVLEIVENNQQDEEKNTDTVEEFNDLPFNYEETLVNGYTRHSDIDEIDEIEANREKFEDSFNELLDKHITIFNDYYHLDLELVPDLNEKMDRIHASREILEGRVKINQND